MEPHDKENKIVHTMTEQGFKNFTRDVYRNNRINRYYIPIIGSVITFIIVMLTLWMMAGLFGEDVSPTHILLGAIFTNVTILVYQDK